MANTSGPQAPIGNGETMNADAAAYYNALVTRIKKETGFTILPTEGTRAYSRQKYLYDGYRAGRIDPATGRKFNPAWSPDDSRAYHLSGRAVDVGSSVGYINTPQSKAFYARANEYGFRPTVQGEPWHFEWRKEWAKTTVNPASSNAKPISVTPAKDNDMPTYELVQKEGDTTIWFAVDRIQRKPVTLAQLADYRWFVENAGQSNKTKTTKDLNVFGVDISKRSEKLLVKEPGTDTVYLSIDRAIRIPITAKALKDYQWWLANDGYDSSIKEDSNITAFGAVLA